MFDVQCSMFPVFPIPVPRPSTRLALVPRLSPLDQSSHRTTSRPRGLPREAESLLRGPPREAEPFTRPNRVAQLYAGIFPAVNRQSLNGAIQLNHGWTRINTD
jgi:hypothetical protein